MFLLAKSEDTMNIITNLSRILSVPFLASARSLILAVTVLFSLLVLSPFNAEVPAAFASPTQEDADVAVQPGKETLVTFTAGLPEGFHLNLEAPSKVRAKWASADSFVSLPLKEPTISISVPPISGEGDILQLSGTIYLCNEGEKGICLIRPFSLQKTVKASPNGVTTIPFSTELPGP